MLSKWFVVPGFLVACAAAGVLGSPSTAEAKASVSPFKGRYTWPLAFFLHGTWNVKVSGKGAITGRRVDGVRGRLRGTVEDGGRIEFDGWHRYVPIGTDPGNSPPDKVRFAFSGAAALQANGDIVGTSDTGGLAFRWTPRTAQ